MADLIPDDILPFGSGDDSVLFESALTSVAASVIPVGGTIALRTPLDGSTGGSFDANGYKTPITGTNRAEGFIVDLGTSVPPSLQYAGQISFETEWEYMTNFNRESVNLNAPFKLGTPTSHGGHDFLSDSGSDVRQEFIGMSAVDTDNATLRLAVSPDLTAQTYTFTNGTTSNYNFNIGKSLTNSNGDFCRVTVCWNGKNRQVYINGCLTWSGTDITATPALFRYLFIANGAGGFTGITSGQHIKNVTLSTRAVGQSLHPGLATVVVVGDSSFDNITDFDDSYTTGNRINVITDDDPWGSSAPYAIRKVMADHGLSIDELFINDSASGATIYDSANDIKAQLPAALARKPSLVCYRGGINDAIAYHQTNLTDLTLVNTQLKLDAATILDTASVEYLIIGTVTTIGYDYKYYDSDLGKAAVDTINGYINGLQAAMTAIDAAYAGRIIVIDQFTAFGGHTLTNSLGYFQEVDLGGDVHPGSYGSWKMGELYAKGILKVLG